MTRKNEYNQHFLRSPRIVAELVGHSDLKRGDLVYDLGAGSGVISFVLQRRVHKVVAVENEPRALEQLRYNLNEAKNVQIIDADLMDVDLPEAAYKVFSNPPFAIISELVQKLAFDAHRPTSIYLVAQRQFAQKIVPSNQRFTSALGVQLFPLYVARIRRPLRRTDFTPPPAVDTVLLELRLREESLLEISRIHEYRQFVAERFARPQLLTVDVRSAAGIGAERKPSEIPPTLWLLLFEQSKQASIDG